MHDHQYCITFLKTPFGFLAKSGFTQDINSEDLALLPSNSYGKWSSMERRIEFFCEFYQIEEDVLKKLLDCKKECETVTYYCENGTNCENCFKREVCEFWNHDRNDVKLSRLY